MVLRGIPQVIEPAEMKGNLEDLGLEITSITRMYKTLDGKKVNQPLKLLRLPRINSCRNINKIRHLVYIKIYVETTTIIDKNSAMPSISRFLPVRNAVGRTPAKC